MSTRQKFLSFGLTFIFIVNCLNADTYIKTKYHSDRYYDMGIMFPSVDSVTEYWIGDNKMMFITDKGMLILDLKRQALYVVNRTAKTYVEIPLPVDMSKKVNEEVISYFQMDEVSGTVKDLAETKKIGKLKCKSYQIHIRDVYLGGWLLPERVERVWVTTDVPFDLKIYNNFSSIIYESFKIAKWDGRLINDLMKIKGFQVASDIKVYFKGNYQKAKREVVEMIEKTPPENFYSVPDGYIKREKLMLQDWMLFYLFDE